MKQKQRMFGILAALVLLLALGVVLATRYTCLLYTSRCV